MHHDGTGGETLLVDGFHAADTLKRDEPEAFKLLSTLKVEHEFIGEIQFPL